MARGQTVDLFEPGLMNISTLGYLAGACLGLGTCDYWSTIGARLPLVAPLDSACLRAQISEVAMDRKVRRETLQRADDTPYAVTYGVRGEDGASVSQVDQGDSSAYLETGYIRINQGVSGEEQDSIGLALGRFLAHTRDACGGATPPEAKGLAVRGSDPPYQAWLIQGTNARVVVRRMMGQYVLQLDTLDEHPGRWSPRWLRVDAVKVPPVTKNHVIATECVRAHSARTGSVLAVVRATNAAVHEAPALVWDLDLEGPRFVPGDTDGVQCRNSAWSSPVPLAAPGREAAARTFTPTPGRARIYVFAPASSRTVGWRSIPSVAIDSQVAGWVGASTFLMVEVEPGSHRVSARAENESSLLIDTAVDSTYFVKVWPKVGFFRLRTAMRRADPSEAQSAIRDGRLVRTWPAGASPRR
jgi:hypothetical protein